MLFFLIVLLPGKKFAQGIIQINNDIKTINDINGEKWKIFKRIIE